MDNNDIPRTYNAGQGVSLESEPIPRLVANLVGKVQLVSNDGYSVDDSKQIPESSEQSSAPLGFTVSVQKSESRPSTSILPNVGDIVYARVTRVSAQQASVEILVLDSVATTTTTSTTDSQTPVGGTLNADSGVGSGPDQGLIGLPAMGSSALKHQPSELGEGFGGIVRLQDIRATERDKVQVQNCFRPGDIIRAQVLSLGDGMNYYLSTAQNELGVVFAHSVSGQLMYPVDWETMRCPVTQIEEPRKCAKPL